MIDGTATSGSSAISLKRKLAFDSGIDRSYVGGLERREENPTVDLLDTLRDQAVETTGSIKLIQQSQGNQARILDDHEARLRRAENVARNARGN